MGALGLYLKPCLSNHYRGFIGLSLTKWIERSPRESGKSQRVKKNLVPRVVQVSWTIKLVQRLISFAVITDDIQTLPNYFNLRVCLPVIDAIVVYWLAHSPGVEDLSQV